MSAPSGYNFAVSIFATPMNFKSLSVRETSTQIDSTSKYNPDGSVNQGYSDTDGDVGTLFIDIDEVIKDEDVEGDVLFFEAGESYINTGYVINGGGFTYSGNSFYVSALDVSGSIPGEARLRISLQSKGIYTKS
jgi:hypothetical protein